MHQQVYIGTSGYHYDDWKGTFYPSDAHSDDFLRRYCRFFNSLELNVSFYRMPDPAALEKFLHPDLKPLVLSMKAYRDLTHGEGNMQLLRTFMQSVKGLISGDCLKTILFQFPFSFSFSEKNWDRVLMFRGETPGVHPVMEFRHSSWFRQAVMDKFIEHKISICGTDMPGIGKLPGFKLPETCSPAYFRFHGRNTQKWWDHDHAWERYDYMYGEDLISSLAGKLKNWLRSHPEAYIYFNNHYRGQAVQNAQQLLAFFADPS